jgi:glutamine cyclotransferase
MGRMIKQIKYVLTLIALLALILFLGFVYTLLRVKDNQTLTVRDANKVSTSTVITAKTKSDNILADTPEEFVYKGVKLQIGSENRWETIYDNLEFRPSILMGDYFIVGSIGYGPRAQLYAFNLKTGKELVLHNEYTSRIYIDGLYRIGDTLYFSTGGYLANGEMYYIKVPFEQNKIGIVEGMSKGGGNLKEIDGNYWIWNGDGDVCIVFGSLSLFDPKTNKAVPIAKYRNDCGTGNELVIAKDKVLNLHSVGEGEYIGTSTYTHVTSIDVNNPQKEDNLISKSDMPSSIHEIIYDKQNNLLLLSGNEKYVYDIYNKILVKKDFVKPKDPSKYQGTYMDSTISKLKEIKLPEGYRFDFSDKAKY